MKKKKHFKHNVIVLLCLLSLSTDQILNKGRVKGTHWKQEARPFQLAFIVSYLLFNMDLTPCAVNG